ncbi:MAG: ABC transporter ATP-binding protein [Chloroflexota bacterium]|nr:ABC transporter ATP-binding protein [Chloroflexota bacterium]
MNVPPPLPPAIELRGITKRFGALLANDSVDFAVRPGEVHALLGENGAGKSTLTKILYGLYQPDAGSLTVHGQRAYFRSPADAIAQGIGMVTQHFSLVPTLTVTENLLLGGAQGLRLNLPQAAAAIQNTAARFGFSIEPNAVVGRLSVGEQQRVEILKALHRDCRVLILDEPTAVLTPQEAETLFVVLRGLVAQGLAVVFISHKLNEVMAIAGRVTVLRQGKVVGKVEIAAATSLSLARLMVGRDVDVVQVDSEPPPKPTLTATPVLQLQNIHVLNSRRLPALRNINLTLHAGEMVGVAGVAGNGQAELGELLSGLRPPTQGHLLLDGVDVTHADPVAMMRAGVGRIPEDRLKGVVASLSVAENMALETLDEFTGFGGQLDQAHLLRHAQTLIDAFDIKATPLARAGSLSGGNLQKVILARVLARQPKLIVAAQPTRGLDVGAIHYVHQQLLAQRARGAAILLISEDLDEVLALADRVVVIYEGTLVGEVKRTDFQDDRAGMIEQIGLMMAGGQPDII